MTPTERQRRAREMYARRPRPSMREIAEELGWSVGTIQRDLNPDSKRKANEACREYMRAKRATNQPAKGRQG